MDKEAATIITSVSAFLVAVFGLVAALGFDVSDTTRNAILGTVGPTVALLLLLGPIIRQYVYSQHTVEQIKDVASGKDAPPPVA